MPRLLFTLASILSLLLLCIALATFWLRSYTLSDQLFWNRADGRFWSYSAPGRLVLGRWRSSPFDQPLPTEDHALEYRHDTIAYAGNRFLFMNGEIGDIDISNEFAAFAWYEKRTRTGRIYSQWVSPFAPLAAATAILPLTWLTLATRSHLRLRRRKNLGLCPTCGYDLRASPGRCPECGVEGTRTAQ